MTGVLREAFALASRSYDIISTTCLDTFTKITNGYDRAGCFLWRTLMDEQFLMPATAPSDSNLYRRATGTYGMASGYARGWVIDTLSTKGASGDLSPKPDIKPALLNMANACATRINWTSPAVIGVAFVAAAVATYAMMHSGAAHHGTDIVGTIYGSAPQTPKPANE